MSLRVIHACASFLDDNWNDFDDAERETLAEILNRRVSELSIQSGPRSDPMRGLVDLRDPS